MTEDEVETTKRMLHLTEDRYQTVRDADEEDIKSF